MLDRKLAPPFSHSHSIALPLPKDIKSIGGVDVLYFDLVKQALIKIEFIYKAGKWYEPSPGISHFTAQMLEKGTGAKTSSHIAEIFDLYGAHVEIAAGFDYTSISLYSLSDKLSYVLPLFIEMLQAPSFPEDELELIKNIFSQNMKVNNEKSSYVASKLIRKNIFGANHPYGNTIEEDDLAAISAAAINKFFADHFQPHEIYVTGTLSTEQSSFLDTQLAGFKKATISPEPSYQISPELKEESKPKEDSVQTTIRMGKQSIKKGHKDFFPLLFLNHILGGYFGSRLMKNIREEKGLTYGIYSSLNTFKRASFFSIGADVNQENQEVTILEIKNELIRLSTELIPASELAVARNHFIGSIQLDMANPFSVIEKIKNIRLNQLDKEYYTHLLMELGELTPSHLKVISEEYLNPDTLSLVKVG